MQAHIRSSAGRFIASLTVTALVVACGSKSKLDDVKVTPAAGSGSGVVLVADPPPGLDLRLSNGKEGKPGADHATLAPAKKLGDAEAAAVLARATAMTVDAADRKTFALRPGSQPAPRTGQTISASFPADPSTLLPPKASEDGKDLRVLRWMPEGAIPLAPELSVTFSQPMIAVTSQDDAAATKPVKLTPTPPGKWRWLGTRTILFDPAVRFPQATTYQVEIPAGTKSATGGVLKEATKFSFETPPPSVAEVYPGGSPQRTDVPMFVAFDQRIDPQAVLAKIKVSTGAKAYALRLLDAAEIARADVIKELVAQARQATADASGKLDDRDVRWLAFRATEPFPADTEITLEVPVGTPSAEGPNTTKEAKTLTFHTFPPLKIERAWCGYENAQCRPGMGFEIVFNNPLDTEKFDAAQIKVTPAIKQMKIVQNDRVITVIGQTTPRTSYSVVVPKALVDDFGQTLGTDEMRPFTVLDAEPTFYGPQGLVVLDPAAKQPTLDFFTTNYDQLKVTLYRVTPADWLAYETYVNNRWNHDKPPTMPGTKVFDGLVKTNAAKNILAENHLDLMPGLNAKGFGHVIAMVEPSPWTTSSQPPQLLSWVQATHLAVDVHGDQDGLNVFATELDTGKPASGVELTTNVTSSNPATSDAKGLATLALDDASYVLGRRGDDSAFVTRSAYGGAWHPYSPESALAWYVIDDRKMYRPGEEVALKGWLRIIDQRKHGDVGALTGVTGVSYKVFDGRGNEIAKATASISAAGGFDTKFTLPKTPNLGYTRIAFEAQGTIVGNRSYHHTLRVEEFRRPEFEVTSAASQGPFLVGGGGDVTVDAKYFAGGPLAGAEVAWNVNATQTTYTPPNREDYIFGNWQPWWGGGRGCEDCESFSGFEDEGEGRMGGGGGKHKTGKANWSLQAKTDGGGSHVLHLDFLSAKPAMPMSVTTTASVTDVNRQQWSTSTALIVHPAAWYVGLKTQRPFVEKGTPFDIDVIGVDLDGKLAVGARIDVAAVRLDWVVEKGEYKTKEVDPQACAVTISKDPAPCHFATKEGGSYQVTATIVDPQGRANQTKLTFWVSGGDGPPSREVAQELVQIIPDKKEYTAGNTAELLLQAPFYPAEGVVTWRRSGIVKLERITIDGPTKVITVGITDQMTPNLYVQVDLVGMAARTDDKGVVDPKLPKRPAYAVGTIDLPIPPKLRTLAVTIVPAAAKVSPAAKTTMTVEVRDASGKPVADAEAAVIVVDEAILALAAYKHPDPIDTFYGHRADGSSDAYFRAYVKLTRPEVAPNDPASTMDMEKTAMTESGAEGKRGGKESNRAEGRYRLTSMVGDVRLARGEAIEQARNAGVLGSTKLAKPGQAPEPIAIRSDFNPLAAFAPVVKTDANGKATVEVKMPDNLTRYRVIALVAAGDKQFGKGESAVTARLPLMIRPSAPRFLNFGDTFKLPVVVQNQTDSPMTVRVAVRSTNAAITDGAGREVSVPANDRVELQFPAAAELAGTARFQVVGTNGTDSDAAEVSLPVWTPATTEAFATYGVIDDGAVAQPVALPGKVVTEFGGLEVTTASTNLQALTDAMLYIVHYKFDCAEQRSSRILSIAALRDVLSAFKVPDMPSQGAMEASVDADVKHLSQMQNYDGGFAYWDRGQPSEPYLTVYVTNALVRAQQKRFVIDAGILDKAKGYLRDIENHYPSTYPQDVRWAISAYALSTRKLMGDLDIAKAKKIVAEAGGVEKLGMETNGWLLAVFAGDATAELERKAIVRHAMNKVSETAGAANFTTGYGDGAYLLLSSDRRVDAIMLDALIQEQPSLDLIPKIVTGLLAHRTAGRWLNTQENTWALVALDRYFHVYEKATPDFVSRVWLGADYAGDHPFKGRTTEYFQIDIPMRDVATHDKTALTIQKDGKGRLYYRVGMKYAPASLAVEAADYGFVVTRTYEAVDDAKEVTRSPDGVWHIKAGARVRVKLAVANENRRYHVALVDPLPAGLETMNPALAVTGPIPQDGSEKQKGGRYWWWYRTWYDHQNMRDDRVEAFTQLLWEGAHDYTYVARATTPGNFIVPPTKAEEMYMPETFGRGASDRVIVE